MLGVVIGVLIEAVIAPIPSPIILMTAGFVLIEPELALSAGLWKIIWMITIPAACAQLVGNYLVYGVGYLGGKPLIQKTRKWLGFSWTDIRKVKKKIEGRESLSFVLLRALPVMPLSVISGAAGVLKMDWKQFGLYSFLGMIPRNIILAFIGWRLSTVYASIAESFDNMETLITLTIIGIIAAIIIAHKYRLVDKVEEWVMR